MACTTCQVLCRRKQFAFAGLCNAYGSAHDVPALLRSLVSPDKTQGDEAIYELFGDIWHQGTVYEATAHVVPFLIELLRSPTTRDPVSVAYLLASIASGCGYLEVHARPEWGGSTWRDILGKKGKILEDELERERVVTEAVRHEAAKALPLLAPYLSHAEPEIRSTIASAFGAFPDQRVTYLAMLEQALACEADAEVREVLNENIGRLKTP